MGALMGGMSVTLRPIIPKNLTDPRLLSKMHQIEGCLNLLNVNYTVTFSRYNNSVRIHINEKNVSRLHPYDRETLRKTYGFYKEIGPLFSRKKHPF